MSVKEIELSEVIKIDFQDVKVYPEWCSRKKRNCLQCHMEGKILCQPQFRQFRKPTVPSTPATIEYAKALIKNGLMPVAVHNQTGMPLPTIYSIRGKFIREGILESTVKRYTEEQKKNILEYVNTHPNEMYREISRKFNIEPSYISRWCNRNGLHRRERLERENDELTLKAQRLLQENPKLSVASVAASLKVDDVTLARRLRQRGMLLVGKQARLILDQIKETVKEGIIEAMRSWNPTTTGVIKHAFSQGHDKAGTCPVCKEDCMHEAMVDIVYTFEPCSCGKPEYTHLVEQLYHHKCFISGKK